MSTPAQNLRPPEFQLHHRLALTLEDGRSTVDEMAETFECHRNTILNWIKGRSTPRKRDVRDWALRTGVPFAWLWSGATDTDPRDPADQVNPGSGCYRENVIDVYFGASRQTQAAA